MKKVWLDMNDLIEVTRILFKLTRDSANPTKLLDNVKLLRNFPINLNRIGFKSAFPGSFIFY